MFVLFYHIGNSQSFVDEAYYLIDSLDLTQVSAKDQNLIQSSLSKFYNCETDTCKAHAISHLVEECWDASIWPKYNQWLEKYLHERVQLVQDSSLVAHLKSLYAGALSNNGYFFNFKGEIDKALSFYDQAAQIQREISDSSGLSITYINSAYILLNQGLIDRALDHYYNSLRIEELLGNNSGMATAYNAIGYVFYKQDNDSLAIENYQNSLVIRKEIKDDYGIATCLNNLGLVFRDRNEYTKAFQYFNDCLAIQKEIEDLSGEAISLSNLAILYRRTGQKQKAISHYTKSIELYQAQKDIDGISSTLNALADIYISDADYTTSLSYARKSMEMARKIGYPARIRDAAASLETIHKMTGNWKRAYEYQQVFHQMKDSLFNENTISSTLQKNYQYAFEKQSLIDSLESARLTALKDQEIAAQKMEIKQSNQLKTTMAVGLVAVTILALLVYRGYRQKLSINKKIIHQKYLLEKNRDEIKVINASLQETIERLKQTQEQLIQSEKLASLGTFTAGIAHEINNPVNYISGATQVLFRLLEENEINADSREDLEISRAAIQNGLHKVKGIITSLVNYSHGNSDEFVRYDLIQCIEDALTILKANITEFAHVRKEYPDELAMECIPGRLNQVFVNLIANALQAIAENGNIVITALTKNKNVEVTVEDDGRGISPKNLKSVFDPFYTTKQVGLGTGLGLYIVHGIIKEHGGDIKIDSQEGIGTQVMITMPLIREDIRID